MWLNHRGGPTGDVSVVQAPCLLPSVGGGPVFILAILAGVPWYLIHTGF